MRTKRMNYRPPSASTKRGRTKGRLTDSKALQVMPLCLNTAEVKEPRCTTSRIDDGRNRPQASLMRDGEEEGRGGKTRGVVEEYDGTIQRIATWKRGPKGRPCQCRVERPCEAHPMNLLTTFHTVGSRNSLAQELLFMVHDSQAHGGKM